MTPGASSPDGFAEQQNGAGPALPGVAGRRACQRSGVEVPDLIDPLGELPAVAGALVAVVVDGVVQPLTAVAGAGELLDVGTAGRGVAVQLDRARVRGLHEELPLGLQPLAADADLIPADQFGGDVGHPQRAIRCEQRREAGAVAHHRRVGELAAQSLDLERGQLWPESHSPVSPCHIQPGAGGVGLPLPDAAGSVRAGGAAGRWSRSGQPRSRAGQAGHDVAALPARWMMFSSEQYDNAAPGMSGGAASLTSRPGFGWAVSAPVRPIPVRVIPQGEGARGPGRAARRRPARSAYGQIGRTSSAWGPFCPRPAV